MSPATTQPAMDPQAAIETQNLQLWYSGFEALKNVNVSIRHGQITSLIGPSGCGKSTLLRCFNRMNERFGGVRTSGSIRIQGHDIYAPDVSLVELRKHVGMVFQRPNPLPLSIRENILFGARIHGEAGTMHRSDQEQAVQTALDQVGLWEQVRDRLSGPAIDLSLEQQQKLCIARLLPLKPSIILMDEPCSALDVQGTRAVEDLLRKLGAEYTIVIVTHNMAQAQRISAECIFMLLGEVIEQGPTADLFTNPRADQTRMYISGQYG